MNEEQMGARFRALENGSEPEAPLGLRRFVRDGAFATAAAPLAVDDRPARTGHWRRSAAGIAAALVLLAGASVWLSMGGPSTGVLGPSGTHQATASATEPGPSVSASPRPSVGPSALPTESLVSTAGWLKVGTKHRTGVETVTGAHYDFTEPVVSTPGSKAGARILSDVETVIDGHLALMKHWQVGSGSDWSQDTLTVTFAVVAAARPSTNSSAGFVSMRIDYAFEPGAFADAGPQWVDFLSYDLATGRRISIGDLFTDTNAVLKLISAAAASDSEITQWAGPDQPDPPYSAAYAPKAANFAMWAPSSAGLQVTFAVMTVGPAAAGTPSVVVPWSQLRNLIKPNSYLAWYLAKP